MRKLGWLIVVSLLCASAQAATTSAAGGVFDPRSVCEPGTEHAHQQLTRVLQLLEYGGENITLCRSNDVPLLYAWSRLIGYEQHPYIGWKRTPVISHHISYNPAQLSQLRDDNLIAALLAQQVGHLIKGHAGFDRPFSGFVASTTENAEADYYTGLVLARAGLSEAVILQTLKDFLVLVSALDGEDIGARIRALLDGVQAGGGPSLSPKLIETWRQSDLPQRHW